MSSNVRPETMERITTQALAKAFIDEQIAEIKAQVGDKKVLLALSGGVDSSVVAALLIKAIGKNLVCVHVNHGLLRKGMLRKDGTKIDGGGNYLDGHAFMFYGSSNNGARVALDIAEKCAYGY